MTTRSFLDLCRQADKNFDQERLYPEAYRFSNGRVFRDHPGSGAYGTNTDTSTST